MILLSAVQHHARRAGWFSLLLLALAPFAAQAEPAALPITVDNFETARFSAALVKATNEARGRERRAGLRVIPALAAAAEAQAGTMALRLQTGHGSPFPGRGSPWERVRHEGVEASFVAENVLGIELPPGMDYEQLAAHLVDLWMKSPGHRANLLKREITTLGCAARVMRMPAGNGRLFAAQVFCLPKRQAQLPAARATGTSVNSNRPDGVDPWLGVAR